MKGFEYHLDTCTGCGACQVACQDAHQLLSTEFIRKVVYVEKLKRYVSMSCNHCEDAGCVKKCPTGAMYYEGDMVLHDDNKCIGCGQCILGCPYHSISLSLKHGFAMKCDSCINGRSKGKEPICVASCPTHSLLYKELDESNDLNLTDGKTKPRLNIVGYSHE